MSLTAGLLLIAQSATPIVAEPASSRPVATASVTASARVLRPASVRAGGTQVALGDRQALPPQRQRDEAGTLWIEFN